MSTSCLNTACIQSAIIRIIMCHGPRAPGQQPRAWALVQPPSSMTLGKSFSLNVLAYPQSILQGETSATSDGIPLQCQLSVCLSRYVSLHSFSGQICRQGSCPKVVAAPCWYPVEESVGNGLSYHYSVLPPISPGLFHTA